MNPMMRELLATLIPKREPAELIIVHHVTDLPNKLQLEYERRSSTLGIDFGRLIYDCPPASVQL
jgi:hypothetical protein